MPMYPHSWCFSCPCQDSEPKGFMDKLYAIQDVFISVQNALDEVASFGERVKKYVFWVNKFPLWFLFAAVCCEAVRCDLWFFRYIQLNVFFNEALLCLSFSTRSTFNWTVPFLSWLAITALCLATFLLYLIPLRYLVLAWGESWFHNTQTTTQTDKKCYAMLVERWCTRKGVSVTFLSGSRSFTSKLWNMALALGGWGLCPSRCLMKYLVLIFFF